MQRDLLGIALLALAGGLTRLPFVVGTPINWDAVQFALALDRFSLHDHQPHPPGYILYVLLGRVMQTLVADPALALASLSVVFSALCAPLLYLLAFTLLKDRAVAWGAALLLMASPLALYYGSVGLTYLPEMVASMGVAWLAWRAHLTLAIGAALMLGVTLGLAGGLRQTTLVALLPLCLWAIRGVGRKAWAAFGSALLVTCLAWLLPLIFMSGGLEAYLRESSLLAEAVSRRTSLVAAGLEGLLHNLTFMLLALTLGLGLGVIPLGLWAARMLRFSLPASLRAFLLWWTLPTILFYALTHVGQYGYLLAVLPQLLILSALCARVWGELIGVRLRLSGSTVGVTICAALALPALVYFMLAQGPITARAIWAHEAHWRGLRSALGAMDPGGTVLVTQADWQAPFRLGGYLLPQFHTYAIGAATPGGDGPRGWLYSAYGGRSTYALPHPSPQATITLPLNTHRVVALDEETAEMMRGENPLAPVSLPNGSTLYMLDSPGLPVTALAIEEEKIRRLP